MRPSDRAYELYMVTMMEDVLVLRARPPCIHVCVYIVTMMYICTCLYVCAYIYTYIFICTYVFFSLYLHGDALVLSCQAFWLCTQPVSRSTLCNILV